MAYELLSEEPRKEKKPFKCEQKFHYLVLKPFFFFMSYVSSDLYVFKKPCLATWILMLRKLCYSVKKKKSPQKAETQKFLTSYKENAFSAPCSNYILIFKTPLLFHLFLHLFKHHLCCA